MVLVNTTCWVVLSVVLIRSFGFFQWTGLNSILFDQSLLHKYNFIEVGFDSNTVVIPLWQFGFRHLFRC